MAAETGFMVDGTLYEPPAIDTFNMDEAQVLYDYSGLTLEDFGRSEDVSDEEFAELVKQKIKNPGFLRALMHIAYQRANPRQNPARVKALIGQANMVAALERLGADEETTDDLPPASATELAPLSPRSSVASNGTSGDDSTTTSDEPEEDQPTTTTPESATSSTLHPESSAA